MISYFYRSVREEQLAKLPKFRTGAWVYAENPTEDELAHLTSKFKLDVDLLKDALDPDEIPRIEVEDDIVYMYMRYSYRRGDVVETDPVLLAVGPNFVASISRRALPDVERLQTNKQLFTTQRAKLLLLLLRHLVLSYETNVNYLNRQIRGVRARLNISTVNNRDFVQFVVIEDALNSFLAELVPANLLLQTLLSGRYKLTFYEEDKDLIEDLVQTTRQLNETSRASLHTIVNIREAYSNIMTNNLNRRVELLTSLTVVLTLPTIVFSLWGVNVPVPGKENPHAFVYLIVSTLLVMGVILYWLYRKRWL
ncbi:MAG: mg2 transporter protein CorA family protein magnesium transporter [Patescibacteria group bacterium]|nr:mg2 transporter protein CorA family protein magnesium transporter [Patescibacteria group bacterium]